MMIPPTLTPPRARRTALILAVAGLAGLSACDMPQDMTQDFFARQNAKPVYHDATSDNGSSGGGGHSD